MAEYVGMRESDVLRQPVAELASATPVTASGPPETDDDDSSSRYALVRPAATKSLEMQPCSNNRALPIPRCVQRGHVMTESGCARGQYKHGWSCRQCNGYYLPGESERLALSRYHDATKSLWLKRTARRSRAIRVWCNSYCGHSALCGRSFRHRSK